MTAPTGSGVSPIRSSGLDAVLPADRSAQMLGSARSLFLHGLALLAAAILLGIAEAVALWMGALLVAVGLLVVAASVALVGVVSRFNVRRSHRRV